MTQSVVETPRNTQVDRKPSVVELVPPIDIYENDKELLLIADLPNVTADALTLEVNHPDLRIQGRAPSDGKHPERVYSRSFRLDSTLDVAKIEAKLTDGVLKVHLPKSEPYQVRKIQVKGS
jgi:HSP20 family protein